MMQDPSDNWKRAVKEENEARDMPRHDAIAHMAKPGTTVVAKKRELDGSHIRFPAVSISVAAYEEYGPSVLSPGVCIRYFHTYEMDIVSMDQLSLFKGCSWRKLLKKDSNMIKIAMKRAVYYDDFGIMPPGWLWRSIHGNQAFRNSNTSLVPNTNITLFGNAANDSSDPDNSSDSEETIEVNSSSSSNA
ncbi:hypothetical protein PRIPAC_97360 [Pristionchus pacificus]|uniref:Uncharacterized protein n=1 Tax=Pristionchus pacificus TaxID=54126 RepID=A0A2A6BJP0_PRIPA|nr:hypothetical protein PRIPAC_97360 [Pristionchus pacificus]|eukprot:PDM66053.1 hypothetical protein PRIPAC_45278 [Pristionchus pacificus]